MHRHAYASRKLKRAAGPRRALLRGLLDSLILYERIETTEAKAKELAPYFEKQVTRAKAQTIAGFRAIGAETINPVAAQKLNYDLVNGFKSRNGGYTRIIKTGQRLGDGASMAIVELVLDEDYVAQVQKTKPVEAKKPTTKKPVKKETVTTTITGVKKAKVKKEKVA
ncbi:50S ribosomal protein L17 [Candidatus Saccharibacteria bacterium]|nr:50S ribosomal protein L17 [Candidatus Saccharibacteria bacterium]